MAKYTVDVNFSGDSAPKDVEAYTPTEAAFKAGVILATEILTSRRFAISAEALLATPGRVRQAVEQLLAEDLSSVLVQELRYADR